MSVALIPLWMLSGAMFPASGAHRVVARADDGQPDDLRRLRRAPRPLRRRAAGGLIPASSSAALELAVSAAFAVVAVGAAAALCKRRA